MTPYDAIAPFYDVDMAANMPFDDVAFWAQQVRARGQRVLELGCGTGRITRGLLEAGLDVVAVDRSAPMLAELRRKPWLVPSLSLVRADLHALPLGPAFDVVLAPYSLCTGWLDDADWEAALGGIGAALRPGGWLLIDCFVPQTVSTEFEFSYCRPWASGSIERWRRLTPVGDGSNRIERRYLLRDANGQLQRQIDTEEKVRPLGADQLQQRLDRGGFEVRQAWWDYGPDPRQSQARFYACAARRNPPSAGA